MGPKRSMFAGAAAALALAAGAPAQAANLIDNGSFEDIIVDWAANPALVQTPGEFQHRDAFGVADKLYLPIDGDLLGVIQANFDTTPNTIAQTFTTTRDRLFSGWAAFLGEDDIANDYAFVRIYTGPDTSAAFVELFHSDIDTVGPFGYTEWTQFSTLLTAGTYTLVAGVANADDGFLPSFLLVDKFHVAVPEPGTWALMIAGFGLAGVALRRRRSAIA